MTTGPTPPVTSFTVSFPDPMCSAPDLASAFDTALRQVARALSDGMCTADGTPARPQLEQLRTELEAQRAIALDAGIVDPLWVRETVRRVADWSPESELSLLAALGAIARAR